jgi:GNAT superfamily N-acetyltransferase
MSELVIRRATPADAEGVRALTRNAYAKWVPVIGREPRPMTADYSRAVVEHLIDLLEDGGTPAALIELCREPDHLLIENVAVHADWQGKGLGTRLLVHAESVARDLGFSQLRLYTNAAFASNIAFYQRRGYREDRREVIGPYGITVFMSKRLERGR